MAASAVIRSLMTLPRPLIGARENPRLHAACFAHQNRGAFYVRSSIKNMQDGPKEQQAPVSSPTPAAPRSPKVSTKFSDVLAFGGPAPERINGRLAMVGFVAAMAVELAKGDDLASQLASGGMWWFAGATALLSLASLVPMFKGVSAQARSGGVMTSDAEMWNGRFAMIGLVALVFTEYLKGGALI